MEYELQQNWDKILEHMHIAFSISDVVFRTFIKKLNVYSVQDNLLTILIDDTEIGDSKSFIQKKYSTFLANQKGLIYMGKSLNGTVVAQ